MGKNVNRTVKKIALIIAMLVITSGIAIGLVIWKNRATSNNLPNDISQNAKEMSVSDASTLRELLLKDGELSITLEKDVVVDEALIVKGTKKLCGNKTILMDISAEEYQGVLTVDGDATLILDGVTLDGGCLANGVVVNENAAFTYLSGTIVNGGPYGIDLMGTALMKGGTIENSIHTGVHVADGAELTMEGGKVTNAAHTAVEVDQHGYVKISDTVELMDSGNLLYNQGKADITGGILHDALNCLVQNFGELNINYQGKDEDDKLQWYNAGNQGIYSAENNTTKVHGVHIRDCGRSTIRFVGTNDVVMTNCLIEGTGENGLYMTDATVTVKDVEIKKTTFNGIYQKGKSTLDLENIKIHNTELRGIENYGGVVTGKNIEIVSAKTYGITTAKADNSVGSTTLENVTIKDVQTNCAFHVNGSVLEVNGAEVHNTEQAAVNAVNGGKAKITNLTAYDMNIRGVNVTNGSEATLTNVKLYRLLTDSDFIYIDSTSKLTMNGKSVVSGSSRRGVNVNGIFVMNDGDICNNGGTAGKDGTGVRVYEKGTFTMNGGTIRNNKAVEASGAGVLVAGVFEMNGGTIVGNNAGNLGGGVCLVVGSKFTMKDGKITNNISKNNGGGIYSTSELNKITTVNLLGGEISGNTTTNGTTDGVQVSGVGAKVTMSADFCMGTNKIKLNHYASEDDSVRLRLTGTRLTKHNAELPLVVTPSGSITLNGTVLECDSEESAKAIVDSVMSGDGQYVYYQDGKYLKTAEGHADLDMSGVTDIVAVTNFQELKNAIKSTTSKRIIKICADIEMEETIQIPNGTTVQIMDDGYTRTLSRNDELTSHFFYTRYGTGLIMQGTSEDRLILDGASSQNVDAEQLKVLVQMLGDSAFTNVKFTNSDNSVYTTTKIGSYIYQQNAATTITNCTFENGKCNAGGAIRLDGKATIIDSDFRNNAAVSNEGGAIYVFPGGVLNVSGCTFEDNTTVRNGGAVFYAKGAGASMIQNSTFTGNMATSAGNVKGGAVYVPEGVNVEISDSVFEKNQANSTEKEGLGGAIYSSGALNATDCQFKENVADTHAGAVYVSGQNAVLTMKKTDGTASFERNKATGYAGALLLHNTKLENVTLDGYTFQGNEGQHGGAVEVIGGASAYISNCAFIENVAVKRGGAFDLNESSYKEGTRSELTIVNSTFEKNNAGDMGGALCVQNAKLNLSGTSGIFDTNTAKNNAGAIYMNGGEFIVNDYEFKNNSAVSGGAILLNAASRAELTNAKFYSNKAEKDGGAVYNLGADIELVTTGCVFGNAEHGGNTAGRDGGAVYNKGILTSVDCVFEKNVAAQTGGAINVNSGTAKATDCSFIENTATNNAGGAIFSQGTSLELGKCNFTTNTAKNNGGALYLYGIVSVDDCTFDKNDVTSKNYGESIAVNQNAVSVTLSGTNEFISNETAGETQIQVEDGNDDESCLFVSGKVTGLSVNYSRANIKGIKIAGALDATSDITVIPNSYAIGDVVVGAADGVEDTVFEAALACISVTPESNGGTWGLEKDGMIGKLYRMPTTFAVSTEAEMRQTIENALSGDTINVLESFNISESTMSINKNITITTTNESGVALTRQSANTIFEVLKNITFEISGKVVLDGNKANVTNGTHAIINRGEFILGENAVIQNSEKSNGNGGAIWSEGTLTIDGTLQNNSASGNGGAIYMSAGTISGSGTFVANSAGSEGAGGAIYINAATSAALTDASFQSNTAKSGGALFVNTSQTATFTDTVFQQNHSTSNGGAIYNQGSLTLTNCTIGGEALGNYTSSGHGGALYNASAATGLTITGGNFTENYCVAGSKNGGAIHCASTKGITIKLTNTVFSENHTTNAGGAIFANSTATSRLEMLGCTFDANYAATGGAIYTYGSITGSSCAFTGNHTTAEGGAIYIRGASNNLTFNMNDDGDRGVFKENYSNSNSGGAIFVRSDLSGTISITGYDFIKNKAGVNTTDKRNGGAICIDGSSASSVSINNSTFDANETNNAGGAIRCADTLTIENCKFRNNIATNQGGAIHGGLATIQGKYYFSGNTGGSTYNGIHNDNAKLSDGATAYDSWDAE